MFTFFYINVIIRTASFLPEPPILGRKRRKKITTKNVKAKVEIKRTARRCRKVSKKTGHVSFPNDDGDALPSEKRAG